MSIFVAFMQAQTAMTWKMSHCLFGDKWNAALYLIKLKCCCKGIMQKWTMWVPHNEVKQMYKQSLVKHGKAESHEATVCLVWCMYKVRGSQSSDDID